MLTEAIEYFKTRTQRQLFGICVLIAPFVALFIISLVWIGLKATMVGASVIAGIAAIVFVGVRMAFDDEEE